MTKGKSKSTKKGGDSSKASGEKGALGDSKKGLLGESSGEAKKGLLAEGEGIKKVGEEEKKKRKMAFAPAAASSRIFSPIGMQNDLMATPISDLTRQVLANLLR